MLIVRYVQHRSDDRITNFWIFRKNFGVKTRKAYIMGTIICRKGFTGRNKMHMGGMQGSARM